MMTESAASYLRESLAAPPFHQWLRPELMAVDEERGKVSLRLPLRPEFRRRPDRPEVHGGILAALIDIAGHTAVSARLRHGVPTIDLRIDYLRMAGGEELIATAEVLKLGRSIGVVDIRIADGQGKLVATGRGAFATREG